MNHAERVDASSTGDGQYSLLAYATADYAIYRLDPNGIVTSWNLGAQRFKGYEASEILGQHFSRFYVDEDRRAGLPELALATAAQDGWFESEGWRLRKDGTRFWAHVVIDPVRQASGDLVGFTKITRDLTERKRAAEALRRNQQQFGFLVRAVTDYAIYMLDAEGRVTTWNSGAQRIKGYAPEEIVGRHFSQFYTQQDCQRGEPRRGLEIAARDGRFETEGWRLRKDGSQFWANVVIDPVRDDNGTVLGFAQVTRDITERKEAQRTLEATREAFFQLQKLEAIGQLTGGIVHDFNNLLMVVLGSLELARMRMPHDPVITPLLDNAMLGAQRGTSLTQRMLAFARRQDLLSEPVDVPALVRGMADLLQRALGPTILVETRFPPDLDKVQADVNQLELALLNLAVNARDAMPNGGSIIIAARGETVAPGRIGRLQPGRYVCLAVADFGEGMDEATLARAMEPFFTTKELGKGTGLGLSIIHGLMEQSGGCLLLRSRRGEGTTAELWLPVAKTSPKLAGADRQSSAKRLDRHNDSPLLVLAVDDDSLVLMNTAAMLKNLGHTVLEASSGTRALDIFHREKAIDLVIADHAMPNMTGLQLAQAIKAERPDLPIIVASGYAALAFGSDAYQPTLAKPFTQKDLAEAVADAIHRDPATRRGLKQ